MTNTLNNTLVAIGGNKYAKLLINGRTSGAIERINRIDWILTDLYFQIQIYENLIASSDIEIKINSNALDVGIINVEYDYAQSNESKIIGETQAPTNFSAGAQKQLIIDVVPQTGTTVYASLLAAEDSNTIFAISYNNGLTTREFNAKLIGIHESCMSGGTYVAQIKFLRTNEQIPS